MSVDGLLVQLLTGLASASTLFLIAAGLSLIFGVTRIVNFAHGSLYMVGLYFAYSLVEWLGDTALGFWGALLAAALAVGLLGALIELLILRRIYQAPELFPLLATFALVLVFRDAILAMYGGEELFGPRAPGLEGSVRWLGRSIPEYDLLLIAIGPIVLACLWWVLTRTRWGTLVRAATQDREMVGALGVNQAWLFTSVFALGAFLAGLGGALQLPREPASLELDLITLGDAFVVVVVGGMGSIPGAFLAALIIAELKALCIAVGQVEIFGITWSFSKLTLVVEFIVMAAVLIWRPFGLLGKPAAVSRNPAETELPLRRLPVGFKAVALGVVLVLFTVPWLAEEYPYLPVLMIDVLVAVLFATSLHFIMGPGGMVSFGHAAYFGLGAYGAALVVKYLGGSMILGLAMAPVLAGLGALLFGWFCVRLSGVYLAMLTLAAAQIVWSIAFQWRDVTGGDDGMLGIWPSAWASDKIPYYYLTLALCVGGIYWLRRMVYAPFGYGLRAVRDSAIRSAAIGIDQQRQQWLAFIIAGIFAGVAGGLYAFSKGSVFPDFLAIPRSIDGLIMVLLGGVQALAGPIIGAAAFTLLEDQIARFDYWRLILGLVILTIVTLAPDGLSGFARRTAARSGWTKGPEAA